MVMLSMTSLQNNLYLLLKRSYLAFGGLFVLFFAFPSLASTFPTDAKTTWNEISGNVNHVLVSGTTPKTILGIAIQQGNNASETSVRCGSNTVARNYATNLGMVLVSYLCNDTINVQKSGQDLASVVVTYVDYDLSTLSNVESTLSASEATLSMFFTFFQAVIVFVVIWVAYKAFMRILPL